MSFPASPTNGQISTINGITYIYTSSTNSWARASASLPSMSVTVDSFTGDGSTTSFTLSVTPANINMITVNIDGVFQQKSAFTLASSVITFTGTPIAGAIIEVRTTLAVPSSVLTGLSLDTFTGDGATTNFTLSQTPTSKNFTLVTVGGVVQQKTNYSTSGTTLTFNTAPPSTAPIEVMTFGPAITTGAAAGSNTQVQYNSNGSVAASSSFTFNNSTNTLTVGNLTTVGNINAGNAVITGNVTGNYIIGNGSQLTGLPAGYTNSNVNTLLASYGSNTITTTGAVSVGALTASGVVNFTTSSNVSLGSNSNVKITGGSSSQLLQTDGTGNLTWVSVSGGATLSSVSSGTYYLGMSSTTSGSWATAYVDTSNLYYTSSTGTLYATNYNTSSDRNLKDNIETIPNALDTVNNLRGVGFNWKSTGFKSYGVIAQELEEHIPELVNETNGVRTVNYDAMIGFLIESIKTQTNTISTLEERIRKLEEN